MNDIRSEDHEALDDLDEEPEEPFTDGPLKGKVVRVQGWGAVAWDVLADDGEGTVTACMVGDDRKRQIDSDRCTELAEEDYCGCCGQLGCCGDEKDRRP